MGIEVVKEIQTKVKELNALFDKAADDYIMFQVDFSQDQSFGKGKVAHLIVKAYKEVP